MIFKIKLKELREIVKDIITEAEDDEKRRGPVDKMKGWQPPSNMTHGTDTTDWSQWDRDDAGGEFDVEDGTGDLDESDHNEEE